MRLEDYIKLYKPLGISDTEIVYEYLKKEANHIEFSKMYINLLVEREEESKALLNYTQEMMPMLTQEKYHTEYTKEENELIRRLTYQYICYGDFSECFSTDELRKVETMECPQLCFVDVIVHLHKKYDLHFKNEEEYLISQDYMYKKFREIMDRRNNYDK